jgi:hypothetical protein
MIYHQRKININWALKSQYGNHRSGWSYAVRSLAELHSDSGVFVDGFIEKKFSWGRDVGDLNNEPTPYSFPWIGFIHVPHNIPVWFLYHQSPQNIFQTQLWKESVKYCQGLFCLSEYQKNWLEKQLKMPIVSVKHPTEFPNVKFSWDKFLGNNYPRIVQIGWWLRKLHSIYYLPVKKLHKTILCPNKKYINKLWSIEQQIFNLKIDPNSAEIIDYLSNIDYDLLLSKNIAYLDLYDAGATNTIIECIVRNTPVLVNPLPSVKEYLGENYPFYFENRKQAAQKADNLELIKKTYNYCKIIPLSYD